MFGNRYRTGFCRPLAPMCRPHVNPCLDSGFDPPAKNAAAGKSNRMHAARVDNRQFQIAIEWRSRYWVPHGPPHKAGRPMWVIPRYKRISSGLIFGNCRRRRSPARRPRLAEASEIVDSSGGSPGASSGDGSVCVAMQWRTRQPAQKRGHQLRYVT